MRASFFHLLAFCFGLLWSNANSCVAEETVDFEEDVAPIFAHHCVSCHSPGNAKGDVSLATIADLNELGYVVAGDPDASYLMELITSSDEVAPLMPKGKTPLSDDEVSVVRQWILEGATWPEEVVLREPSRADTSWWSLRPLMQFDRERGGGAATIDGLIAAKLSEQGLARNPPASRVTLIRRATYDLTGLPATLEEIEAFVADERPDAYERVLDRLLASPHYGERWGRHWLDVVRFGESNGFERNVIINELWPFRDYVIRSLNEDKPFDQFMREHIAGDLIGHGVPDIAVGSAFLVSGPYDDVGNQDAAQVAQIRANTIDEIISATSQAFLGMTVGCARCHDHKFDPITQEDYYGLYATFAGVRHGSQPLATTEALSAQADELAPLNRRKTELERSLNQLETAIVERGKGKLPDYQSAWVRPPVDRRGTEERFEPVTTRALRLVCEAQDENPKAKTFRIDEFEIWSHEPQPRNVALSSAGATATGAARQIEDFPDAYGPQLVIDGRVGARFISTGDRLTITLAAPLTVDRVYFSSARGESTPHQAKFAFVADYRIEVMDQDGAWREVASGRDRQPVDQSRHLEHRLLQLETTVEDRGQLAQIRQELSGVNADIARTSSVPRVWIGTRHEEEARGPFHVFLGGSPARLGEEVLPSSLSAFDDVVRPYTLPADSAEGARRIELAKWITAAANPLTPRVLVNRIWQHHFGTGIVETANDFGFMGSRPSHPELLDFLAGQLIENKWQIKSLHRMIMLTDTYRQSSRWIEVAARKDSEARLLWRFPPRRLAAEEIRDTLLQLAGQLNTTQGGPGFRLYKFMQDNVCTYVPLEEHGVETYRRAVYHQNARASLVDLMTDFDQPDCAFSAPRRASTTTPLQALTLLNHSFTLDMAQGLADRIRRTVGEGAGEQMDYAYKLCFARSPNPEELELCKSLAAEYGLEAVCRVLLNTSELIYVR